MLQRFDSKVMDLILPNFYLFLCIVQESFVLSCQDISFTAVTSLLKILQQKPHILDAINEYHSY